MKNIKIILTVVLIVISFSSCKTFESFDKAKEKHTVINIENDDILTKQVSSNYQLIRENTVALSSFNFEIPDDLSLIKNTVNPIAENSDGTFQLMIEDKTELVDDYKEYINATYSKYKTIGIDISNIKTISLNDSPTSRFSVVTKDEKNTDVTIIFYFIEQSDLKIDVIVMLKGNEISDYSKIDNYVANIEFSKTQ